MASFQLCSTRFSWKDTSKSGCCKLTFRKENTIWILWSRCEASPWENNKRKNDSMWKNHFKGLGFFWIAQVGKEVDACEVGYSGNPQQGISWVSWGICKMIEHHEHIGLLEFIGYHFVLAYDLECVCVKVEAIKIYGHFYNIMGNMMINQGFAGWAAFFDKPKWWGLNMSKQW